MSRSAPEVDPALFAARHARWRRLAPLAFILLFVAILLYPLVFQGRALYWGDLFLYFYPLQHVIDDSLRAGRLPLWNPFIYCGQPLVGNPQSAVFYPSSLFAPTIPAWLYFTVNTVLHLTLAGWFTYLYLRRICGDRLAAILGAITYAGSGFVIARLQFPPMVQAIAYLPAIVLMVDRLIERARIRDGALLALAVALEMLAAHTQIAYMTFACATFYAFARLYQIRRHRARAWRAFRLMFAALALGVILCMIHLLPAFQLFVLSTREHLTYKQANRFVFLQENLINFLLPDFYGAPTHGNYWGEGNIWEPYVYVGILPLCLAVYAAYRASRRRAVRFFAVLGLVALWLSMGQFGGLYFLAYYLVPGVAAFHDPARFVFLTTFSIAVLSAVGMRALADRGVAPIPRLGVLFVAALNLWWYNAAFNPTVKASALAYRPAIPSGVRAGEGRMFTAMDLPVWRRYISYQDYGPDTEAYVRELTDTLIPNVGMRSGIEESGGYEPVAVRTATEVEELLIWSVLHHAPSLPRLLGLVNAHALVLPLGFRYTHPGLQRTNTRGAVVLNVREPLPRAWLVRRTKRVEGGRRTMAAIAAPDFDPCTSAVVSGSAGLGESKGLEDAPPVGSVSIRSRAPGRWIAEVDAGTAPAFLVWSATFYPGWTGEIDGKRVRLERTNNAFTGVVVPPGRHRIVFEYRPFVFRLGQYLTLAASTVVAFGMAQGIKRRR